MSAQKNNPYVYPYHVGSPRGVLGDMPPQRTVTDQNDQVFFGCGVTELYEPMEGVLGSGYYGQRSKTDKWMQKNFGCDRENFDSRDQKKTLEQRQRNNLLGKHRENYCSASSCGGASCNCDLGQNCPFARTSDIPSNPWNKYAKNLVLR